MAKKQKEKKKEKKDSTDKVNKAKESEAYLLSLDDYSLLQDSALYSEVVVSAHIRISNESVRRSSYAVEMRVAPNLGEEIPDNWGMVKFTEVLPEVGRDGGPAELFLTRPVAATEINGDYLQFQNPANDPLALSPNPADFLNARIARAVNEVIKLHQAALAKMLKATQRSKGKGKEKVATRKGP
jgi:hypothetical protein